MMDERMEEQASLHVLGALSDVEAREFKKILHADPELQKFVARLSTDNAPRTWSEACSSMRSSIIERPPVGRAISAARDGCAP